MENTKLESYYYDILIRSLFFSLHVESDLDIYFKDFDRNKYLVMVEQIGLYIEHYQDNLALDDHIRNNIYKIISYLSQHIENYSDNDKILVTDFVNSVKRYLNQNFSSNINDYIREQILIRDYGMKKSNLNLLWQKLKHVPDESIEFFKNEYYESISQDIVLLLYLLENPADFYNYDYKVLMFNNNFYRTVNYLVLTKTDLFLDKDYLERINFVIDKNIETLINIEQNNDNYVLDCEFCDLHNVNCKLLKKTYSRRKK